MIHYNPTFKDAVIKRSWDGSLYLETNRHIDGYIVTAKGIWFQGTGIQINNEEFKKQFLETYRKN